MSCIVTHSASESTQATKCQPLTHMLNQLKHVHLAVRCIRKKLNQLAICNRQVTQWYSIPACCLGITCSAHRVCMVCVAPSAMQQCNDARDSTGVIVHMWIKMQLICGHEICVSSCCALQYMQHMHSMHSSFWPRAHMPCQCRV